MEFCECCLEDDKAIEGTERENGVVLCDNCCDSMAEAAHERFLEDYYGGSGPVTIDELYQKAAAQKADWRRRH